MTAVAPPPSFQPIPRSAWHTGSGGQGSLDNMSTEEVSRMFIPRKNLQRNNSSSSVASSSSSTSTVTVQSSQQNGVSLPLSGDLSGWGSMSRKKPTRSQWPSAKAEPVSATSNARPQTITAQGPSQGSGVHTIYQPPSILPSQHGFSGQQNGIRGNSVHAQTQSDAMLCLLPMNGTFERKAINVPFFPEVLRIGRQTNAKTVPTPHNGYFDSKVLSRQHAEIWADKLGKIWIRDVKSSNGTFVNGQRLSRENHDSEPHELRDQDILELGIDIVSEDQKSIVHHKVAARIEHAGIYPNAAHLFDLNLGDIDQTSGGSLIAHPQGIRGRSGSHGVLPNGGRYVSMASGFNGNNVGAVGQQRQMNFWLTPITIEQIVKKLTNELRTAKQQSFDLQRSGEFFGVLNTNGVARDQAKPIQNEKPAGQMVVKVDSMSRFSEPPAPPPQQPLPEKPSAVREDGSEILLQGSLRRSDTEKPSIGTNPSPTKPQSSQIISLVEALESAKREIKAQGARVKHLEERLQEERSARESAEGRAQQLEMTSREEIQTHPANASESGDDGKRSTERKGVLETRNHQGLNEAENEKASTKTDDDDSARRLQQRLDLMMVEMNQMKQMMETYKVRAETAEKESASSRKTLAEMVERIRREESDRDAKRQKVHDGLPFDSSDSNSKKTDLYSLGDAVFSTSTLSSSAYKTGEEILTGGKLGPSDDDETNRSDQDQRRSSSLTRIRSLDHDHLVHSAPYASILGVVAIGFGLMAYLNGWQKVEQ
ncbi:MAG: hypothetical protein M1816_000923 [Peltula sp. TS41687]|nr:MAG: hypothetical protein M1816_000923 [Peltula sp. TS41687]